MIIQNVYGLDQNSYKNIYLMDIFHGKIEIIMYN